MDKKEGDGRGGKPRMDDIVCVSYMTCIKIQNNNNAIRTNRVMMN